MDAIMISILPAISASFRKGCAVVAVFGAALFVSPAGAGMLDIDGQYGDELGCEFAKTKEYRGDETMTLLTTDGFESFVTACEFLQSLPASDGSHVLTMLCGHEGDAAQTIEAMRIVKTPDVDAYEMYHEGGELYASVKRCS